MTEHVRWMILIRTFYCQGRFELRWINTNRINVLSVTVISINTCKVNWTSESIRLNNCFGVIRGLRISCKVLSLSPQKQNGSKICSLILVKLLLKGIKITSIYLWFVFFCQCLGWKKPQNSIIQRMFLNTIPSMNIRSPANSIFILKYDLHC